MIESSERERGMETKIRTGVEATGDNGKPMTATDGRPKRILRSAAARRRVRHEAGRRLAGVGRAEDPRLPVAGPGLGCTALPWTRMRRDSKAGAAARWRWPCKQGLSRVCERVRVCVSMASEDPGLCRQGWAALGLSRHPCEFTCWPLA